MKVIVIFSDTFRYDHVGANGNREVYTPNLDRLAAMSHNFDHNYVGSFPTIPNRRDIHIGYGMKNGKFNVWRPLENDETTLAERLGEKGVDTMMINDVANSVTKGYNYFKGFAGYTVNRGQEGDYYWLNESVPTEFPVEPRLIRYTADRWHQVLVNRARRRVEDDWFAPGTFKMACEWLEQNHARDNYLLWVETFDPHEPWDPPQWHIDRYDPGYKGRVFEAPTYGVAKEMGMTPREVRHIHARYMGECTMVDFAVGRLMATLEKLGQLDDVAIVFTSDHGAYFGLEGDNGLVCKPNRVGADGMLMSAGGPMKEPSRALPMTLGTMRIPLMVHLPGQKKAKRIGRVTQPWDLTPTLLDLFGLKAPPEFYGESLLPLLAGKKRPPRACAFNGAQDSESNVRQAIDKNWLYAWWSEDRREPLLLDLKHDRTQSKNVIKKHPDVAKKMRRALAAFDPDVPAEQ